MFLHEFIFNPTDCLRNDIRENTKRKIYKDVNIFFKNNLFYQHTFQ